MPDRDEVPSAKSSFSHRTFSPRPRRIAGYAGAVDATADDGDVDQPVIPARIGRSARHRFPLRFFSTNCRAAAFAVRALAGFGFDLALDLGLGACNP